jgi:hypothetical protein
MPGAHCAVELQNSKHVPFDGSQRYAPQSVWVPSTAIDVAPSAEHVGAAVDASTHVAAAHR